MTSTVDDDFLTKADPLRRELFAHCYRMVGSVHDAEDLVQETYLRAWRAYDRFEGRSSLRTWLYRIATTTCLTALENRQRRPMPTGLGASAHPDDDVTEHPEVPWLEPVPDTMIGATRSDPATIVATRASTRLALIAALQHLPSRQRAVLLLRDVLAWRAAEVADLLGTSTAAVNSILQRARTQLGQAAPDEDQITEPTTQHQRELLDRYVQAFEKKDIPAIVELFSTDIVWEMPPLAEWYRGPEHVGRHLALRCPGGAEDIRMVETSANGQPAFAQYLRDPALPGGDFLAFNLQVLSFSGNRITHVANFLDPALFENFDLPMRLPG
ncbi:RNA polymerase, sigma subunit, ECF family [Amycolatopsis marina]|uniref:RNA polymerase sigma factor n=1 Tax=Amycolatopsis marina TaxID=490629 RepID=A0A1I1BJC7_9PSEU|nr:RNA polymerase, sigma subunit, ECF family [Amycolatopsis marina]